MIDLIRSLDGISWQSAIVLVAAVWSFTKITCEWMKLKHAGRSGEIK